MPEVWLPPFSELDAWTDAQVSYMRNDMETVILQSGRLVEAEIITPEIMQIDCLECLGEGWWDYYPEPIAPSQECVRCKGTGKVYVS